MAKYVVTLNGKNYEVEVHFESFTRGGGCADVVRSRFLRQRHRLF